MQQVRPAGVGVDLDQRPQRRLAVVVAVLVVAALLVRLRRQVPGATLAVVQRVVRRHRSTRAIGSRRRAPRRRRACRPSRSAAPSSGTISAVNTAPLACTRHVGAVVVPALVAAQRLDDVVVGLGVHRAVAADVGDRRRLELEVAEPPGELVLLVAVRNWPGKISSACSSQAAWSAAQVVVVEVGEPMPRTIAPNVASSGSISMALTPTVAAYSRPPILGAGAIRARRRSKGRGTRSSAKASTSAPAYCSFRPLVVPMNRRRVTSIASPRCAGWFCNVRNLPSCPSAAMTRSTSSGPERTDELVFEVLVAHEEAERLEVVGAECSLEDPRLTGVVEPSEAEVGSETAHEVADVRRAAHGDDLDALRPRSWPSRPRASRRRTDRLHPRRARLSASSQCH